MPGEVKTGWKGILSCSKRAIGYARPQEKRNTTQLSEEKRQNDDQEKKDLQGFLQILKVCLRKLGVFLKTIPGAALAGVLAAVLLLEILLAATYHPDNPTPVSAGTPVEHGEISVSSDGYERVTFTAVGDNLIHNTIYEQAAERAGGDGYDFSYAYAPVADFFKNHDVNWINMETIVNDVYGPSGYPWFSTPGDNAKELYDTGFRIFSLSSNHTYDYRSDGVGATVEFYENEMPSDIVTTGIFTDTDEIPICNAGGHTIAFLTYTYDTNEDADSRYGRVILLSETELIERQIKRAKELADCVVVSCHWGDENHHEINDTQRAMAKNIANWGADLIIGTHPHVVQDFTKIETDDARMVPCIYSLGNFISAQKKIDCLVGLIFECTFAFPGSTVGGKNVKIEDISLIPIITHYDEGFDNLRVMFLSDYTQELAEAHGVNEYNGFAYPEIFNILNTYVPSDALVMPEEK